MFPGFPTRLENDLRKIYRQKVLKDPNGKIKLDINIIVINLFRMDQEENIMYL